MRIEDELRRSLRRRADDVEAPGDLLTRPLAGHHSPTARVATIVVALVIGTASFGFLSTRTEDDPAPSGTPTPELPPITGFTLEEAIPAGEAISEPAVADDGVWVTDFERKELVKVDPVAREVELRRPLNGPWPTVVASGGTVWLARGGVLERLDPSTGEPSATVELPGNQIGAIAATPTDVWVETLTDWRDPVLVRVSAAGLYGVTATIPLGDAVSGYEDQIEVGSDAVWVMGRRLVTDDSEEGGDLLRIDPDSNQIVATIPVGGFSLALSRDGVWIKYAVDGLWDANADEEWGTLLVDPMTNEVSARVERTIGGYLGTTDQGIVTIDSTQDERLVVRIVDPDTLQPLVSAPPIDPYATGAAFDPRTGIVWVSRSGELIPVVSTSSSPAEPPQPSPGGLEEGWQRLPDPPEVRSSTSATVWTGSDVLVWGGYVYTGFSDEVSLGSGFAWNPLTGERRDTANSPLAPRSHPAYAWTGDELLVWGGATYKDGREAFADGAAYEPASDSWRPLQSSPLSPRAPILHVWTGRELVVWGDASDDSVRDGAAYDVEADAWRPISPPPAGRWTYAEWDGSSIVAFANRDAASPLAASYDPATDTWTTVAPPPLSWVAATTVSGGRLIVWGADGRVVSRDSATGTWEELPKAPLELNNYGIQAVPVGDQIFGQQGPEAVALDDAGKWRVLTQDELITWDTYVVIPAGDSVIALRRDPASGEGRAFIYTPGEA